MEIPFIDLKSQYELIREQIKNSIDTVLDHGKFINGPEVNEFETNLKSYTSVKHAITCANGTDALAIALLALKVQSNDAVFVPSFTYIASAESIALVGGVPYFVDVGDDYNICPKSLEIAIDDAKKNNHNPRIVIPVDLFGKPSVCVELDELINNFDLETIYDAAQSFGSSHNQIKIGNFGDITTTSFFPAKPLGCYGDGGAIFTNNDDLAKKIKMYSNHGESKRYHHNIIGINSRLDSIQAEVLNVKFKYLNDYNNARNQMAENYNKAFKSVEQLQIPELNKNSTHVYHQYTLRVHPIYRDSLRLYLKGKGIDNRIYYPIPLHKQKVFSKIVDSTYNLPNTNLLSATCLSLPIHTEIENSSQEYIIDNVLNFFK